jgi:hypothetical protein
MLSALMDSGDQHCSTREKSHGVARVPTLVLRERGSGVSLEAIRAATAARLLVEGDVPEMRLD